MALKRHCESGPSRTIYIALHKEPCSFHNALSSKQSDKFSVVVILVSYLRSLLVTTPCIIGAPANAGDLRDEGLLLGWGRSPGGGPGNPLRYCCLENSMDGEDWRAAVYRVAKNQTGLRDQAHTQARTPRPGGSLTHKVFMAQKVERRKADQWVYHHFCSKWNIKIQIKREPEADSGTGSCSAFLRLSLTSASFPTSFYLHSEYCICWVSGMPGHVCQADLAADWFASGHGLRLGLLLKFKHIQTSLAN